MRLWTIQPLAVDEIIRKNGYYVCDISKSPYSLACESFKKAYDWMNEQMAKRIELLILETLQSIQAERQHKVVLPAF